MRVKQRVKPSSDGNTSTYKPSEKMENHRHLHIYTLSKMFQILCCMVHCVNLKQYKSYSSPNTALHWPQMCPRMLCRLTLVLWRIGGWGRSTNTHGGGVQGENQQERDFNRDRETLENQWVKLHFRILWSHNHKWKLISAMR